MVSKNFTYERTIPQYYFGLLTIAEPGQSLFTVAIIVARGGDDDSETCPCSTLLREGRHYRLRRSLLPPKLTTQQVETVEVAIQTEERILLLEYEDLSSYYDEDIVPVTATPVTKKQAALCLAARAGKSRPAKIPPSVTSPPGIGLAKAIVIHGIPCQRPMADIIQDVGEWDSGRRLALSWGVIREQVPTATSSVLVFFDGKLAVGSHLEMRGRRLLIEAYDLDRGRKRVEYSSDW